MKKEWFSWIMGELPCKGVRAGLKPGRTSPKRTILMNLFPVKILEERLKLTKEKPKNRKPKKKCKENQLSTQKEKNVKKGNSFAQEKKETSPRMFLKVSRQPKRKRRKIPTKISMDKECQHLCSIRE